MAPLPGGRRLGGPDRATAASLAGPAPTPGGGRLGRASLRAGPSCGDADLDKRKLVERRVEGERILMATVDALGKDADLLAAGEREAIDATVEALLSEASEEEEDALDKAFDMQMSSRLGCQARVLRDGLIEVAIARESVEAYYNEHPGVARTRPRPGRQRAATRPLWTGHAAHRTARRKLRWPAPMASARRGGCRGRNSPDTAQSRRRSRSRTG